MSVKLLGQHNSKKRRNEYIVYNDGSFASSTHYDFQKYIPEIAELNMEIPVVPLIPVTSHPSINSHTSSDPYFINSHTTTYPSPQYIFGHWQEILRKMFLMKTKEWNEF